MQPDERKLATVLFADLVGSTALASEQDPERTRARLERFYDAMAAEVDRAGGTVEKFAGDAVMAAFGAPTALEDHAERALHAALAMRRALEELFGAELELRVGVNTGEVVVGRAREGSSFVSGDAVNVAARLEQAAAGGEILVGERTAAAVRGAFEFLEPRTVEAKGKPGGLACRPLSRALSLMRPRGFGGLGHVFVGREAELESLRAAYRDAVDSAELRLVTLVGDAGAGKTTLVRELWDWLGGCSPEPLRRAGRCLAYGQAVTYRPLADVLREHLDLLESDPAELALDRLGERRILGLTLGLDVGGGLHPLAARDRLQEAWAELLEELTVERPVVMLIEDVHWAEEPLLELLDRLRRDVRGPLLLVCTARPELLERRGTWARGAVQLEPLPPDDTAELVDRLLGGDAPEWARSFVVDRAEGNPFFAEELLRTLIDQGVLTRDGDGWTGSLPGGFAVPDSVRALVAARIDLLGGDEKAALQAAAVIGRAFWSGPVYELAEGSPELLVLEDRDFVRRRAGSTLAGEREYTFKHSLTREVAYASLPTRRRARLHADFARWLERAGEGRDEHAALLAHHYAEGVRPEDVDLAWPEGGIELEELRGRAVVWLRRAAELAVARYELDDGEALLGRALELTPDDPDLWRRVGRVGALRYDGRGFLAAMQQALEHEPDDAKRAELYAELAFESAIRAGMWRTQPQRKLVEEWLASAFELAPPGSRTHAQALAAKAFWHPRENVEAAREASELAERLDDLELRSYALGARSSSALESHQFGDAAIWADRRLELLVDISDPDHVVDAYETAISAITSQARLDEARRLAAAHVETSQRLSPHHRVHAVAVTLDVEELAGNWEAISALTARTETTVAANVETPCVRNVRALLVCAVAALQLGDDARAAELEEAADAWEMQDFGAWLSQAKLRLALVRGDLDRTAAIVAKGTSFRHALGPAVLATHLDALTALRDRRGVEELAPRVRESAYLQPFALRALGVVREDEALVEQAAERFDALGLARHAAETRRLVLQA